MTANMTNLFFDVQPSKCKLTSFLDGKCYLIASIVSEYSHWQVLAKGAGERKYELSR